MSNKGKRYGVCENFEKCNKAKAGEKIELDELDDFICPECHSDLREVQPVKGTNWKLIGGVAALVILGGGAATYFALSPTQPELEGLSLSISAQELFKGDIDTLKVTTTPIDCPATYTWTSSDEKVAKVDANGVVTMTGEGEATVIVTAVENAAAKDSCVYTVKGIIINDSINVEDMTSMEAEKEIEKKANRSDGLHLNGKIWEGPIVNGKPHGIGVMKFTSSQVIDSRDPNKTMANKGDYLTGAKYENGKLIQGQLHRIDGTQKAIVIGQ